MDEPRNTLPPIEWLRTSGWGIDATRAARDPNCSFPNTPAWRAMLDSKPSAIDAAVAHARLERLVGPLNWESVRSMRDMKPEADGPLASYYAGSFREVLVAREVAHFAAADSPVAVLAPDMVATLENDPTADPDGGDFLAIARTLYVVAEGGTAKAADDGPLNGILLSRRPGEDGDLFVLTAMSTLGPRFGRPSGRAESIVLELGPGTPLSTSIANGIAKTVDRIADGNNPDVDPAATPVDEADDERAGTTEHYDPFRPIPVRKYLRQDSEADDDLRRGIADEEIATSLARVPMMRAQAAAWARLLGAAMRLWADPTAGRAAWQDGAPAGDVAKAMSGSTGARKADQRLRASGWAKVRIFDGTTPCDVPAANTDACEPTSPPSTPPEDAIDPTVAPALATTMEAQPSETAQPVVPARRLRRLARIARSSALATRDASDTKATTTVAEDRATVPDEPDDAPIEDDVAGTVVASSARADPDLLARVDEATRIAFRDLPSLETRTWEASFPPALAGLVMRRAVVDQPARETQETTRRRLSADILPRFADAPPLLRRLNADKAAHPRARRAHAVGRISVMRDVDPDIAVGIAHPVHALVSDERLDEALRFHGVGRALISPIATTLVTAWRENRTLHLIGSIHEGCMTGFRRVEWDLDDGTVATFDADADDDAPGEILDLLWGPIADALLGPVDEWDAWRWERRRAAAHDAGSRPRPARTPTAPVHARDGSAETPDPDHAPAMGVPADVRDRDASTPIPIRPDQVEPEPEAEPVAPPSDTAPVDADFADWKAVCAPYGRPDAAFAPAMLDAASSNSVLRVVMRMAEGAAVPDASAAARRHLAALGDGGRVRLATLDAPDMDAVDDVDLSDAPSSQGAIVVSDGALFAYASPGIHGPVENRPERPMCILWRLRPDGIAALLLQVDADAGINLVSWTRLPPSPPDDEGELHWYLRGAIALATDPGRIAAPVSAPTAPPAALPAMATPPSERLAPLSAAERAELDAPRRVVAQVRMRPESMAAAIRAAATWFDQTAERNRLRMVSDHRADGRWTIEHRSQDRLNPAIWSTTLRLADDGSDALDVILATTMASGVRPGLPGLVRSIVAATPTTGPDGPLVLRPTVLSTRSDLNSLLRDLQSPDRVLPMLVMTQDDEGRWTRDPADVAAQSLGALTIRLLPHHMTFELTDALGQEYRTFNGAARLFQPRFNADADPSSRHPRVMPGPDADRILGDLVTRTVSATSLRYAIPEIAPMPERDAPPAPPTRMGFLPTRPSVAHAAPRTAVAAKTRVAPPPTPARDAPPAPIPSDVARLPQPAPPPPAFDPAELAALVEAAVARRLERAEPAPAQPVASAPAFPAPTPAPTPARTFAPEPPARNGTSTPFDADAVRDVVAAQVASLGVATLVDSVSALVGRIDAFVVAVATRTQPASGPDARDARIVELEGLLAREQRSGEELLAEAAVERGEAIAERDAAEAQVARLRREIGELRRDGPSAPSWPDGLDGLADWLEENPLANLVVTRKAYNGMKRVRHGDMERLCRALVLLDGAYVDQRQGVEGARARWLQGMKTLRLENRKQTEMGKGIRNGTEYRFEHDGRRWEMDFHLRGIESLHNEPERLLRIYFAYDEERGRVLVGHMPTHLTTVDS